MKTHIKLILGGFFLFGLYSCANSKKIQDRAPVSFEDPFYSLSEEGGVNDVAVLELYLPLSSQPQPSVVLDSVYFRGRIAKLYVQTEAPNMYVGRFEIQSKERSTNDMILSSDPREEYGNKPPIVLNDFPFDLESNQAVVQYQEDGEVRYFKVFNIEEKDLDSE